MPPRKVIIDTDPGIDDVHALILALAAHPKDLEVLLVSVSWGNVDAQSCLLNAVSTFHVIQKELEWRKQHGRAAGFKTLETAPPILALGAQAPLDGTESKADFFHGKDGLGEIHENRPHLSPTEAWKHLFDVPSSASAIAAETESVTNTKNPWSSLFRPSYRPSHLEILELLANNPADTIDIIAVGPLTTIAQAAAADPSTFLRAKRLVVMGGSITEAGNITPLAEFNFYADAVAAARVLALTSPIPASTMPKPDPSGLAPYPSVSALGPRRLRVVLFPLDITHQHPVFKTDYSKVTDTLVEKGSPLAEWLSYLYLKVLSKHSSLSSEDSSVVLHDPICVWYVLQEAQETNDWVVVEDQDVRVDVAGQWTRGACITDRRDRKKMVEADVDENNLTERTGDEGGWLSQKRGNRVGICTRTPGSQAFTSVFLKTAFGST